VPRELHLVDRLLWAESLPQQREQFGLPPGEPEMGTRPFANVDFASCEQRRLGREAGRDHGLACGQPLQGVDQFLGGCRLEQIATYAHPQHLE
jgi:hypothetical protein